MPAEVSCRTRPNYLLVRINLSKLLTYGETILLHQPHKVYLHLSLQEDSSTTIPSNNSLLPLVSIPKQLNQIILSVAFLIRIMLRIHKLMAQIFGQRTPIQHLILCSRHNLTMLEVSSITTVMLQHNKLKTLYSLDQVDQLYSKTTNNLNHQEEVSFLKLNLQAEAVYFQILRLPQV